MHLHAESSMVVCRVCGTEQELDTRAVVASAQLAAFSHAHGQHPRFRIDVVVRPPAHEGPVPEQRWAC